MWPQWGDPQFIWIRLCSNNCGVCWLRHQLYHCPLLPSFHRRHPKLPHPTKNHKCSKLVQPHQSSFPRICICWKDATLSESPEAGYTFRVDHSTLWSFWKIQVSNSQRNLQRHGDLRQEQADLPAEWLEQRRHWLKGLIMDGCVLLTSTPECVVSPRGETTHEGVDVNNTHPSMINPDYNMILANLTLNYQYFAY